MHTAIRCLLFAPVIGALGCVPDFEDDTSRVIAPRVVAIQADPPEAAERANVTLRALLVAPDSTSAPVDWSLCLDRKALSELGPVSPRCLESPEPAPEIATALGTGSSDDAAIQAPVPAAACQLFGPQRPDPRPGEPSGRPVDPDPTGGFYQPVVAWLGPTAVLGAVRITCPLTGATREGLISFNQHYRPNHNPEPLRFEVVRAGGEALDLGGDDPVELRAGEAVRLRVTWPDCPDSPRCGDGICALDETAAAEGQAAPDQISCVADCATPRGCGGAERYVSYDPLAQEVIELRETFVVSWYATDGRFDAPRTDRSPEAGSEGVSGTLNGYVVGAPGTVQLWAVVRDDRGGVAWLNGTATVSN